MIRRPPRSTRTDTFFPYATLFRSSGHSKDFRVQVPPVRVLLFDQRQLSRTRSGLDLLLAGDGVRHRREHLEPDEQAAAVPRGEAGNEAFSMFPDAAPEVDRKSTRLNSSH